MKNNYYENFVSVILENSESKNWDEAKTEWDITDVYEDESLSESCICGKENLRYVYTITNRINGKSLYPIGSHCITHFENANLNERIETDKQLFKLAHAINAHETIDFSSKYFSKKLLTFLYDNKAFKANKDNDYNPKNDLIFLLNMFNMKKAGNENQQKSLKELYYYSIVPFVKEYAKIKEQTATIVDLDC